jgi:hypothetical protein
LLRRELTEGLVRPDGVVAELLSEEEPAQLCQRIRRVKHLVELLFVGALGSLDAAVELGWARRQDEEAKPLLATGLLELGLEFGAAVDLDGLHGTGHALEDGVEEVTGGDSGGPAVDAKDIPAADDVTSAEVLVPGAEPGSRRTSALSISTKSPGAVGT